jgi:hypothetical protein
LDRQSPNKFYEIPINLCVELLGKHKQIII